MTELRAIMRRIVTGSSDKNVALMMSAGIDSVSTGIICEEVGTKVHAYTYELHGYSSHERGKAEALARHLKWPLSVVTVQTRNLASDFKRLAIQQRLQDQGAVRSPVSVALRVS